MMRSEFIERTGFEPTADEYSEIEEEYYGFDGDKDAYCKQWKKNGGIERLMRRRATRIEELERELAKKDDLFNKRTESDNIRYHEMYERMNEKVLKAQQEVSVTNQTLEDVAEVMKQEKARADEAERKLAILKEAFAIITGKENKDE